MEYIQTAENKNPVDTVSETTSIRQRKTTNEYKEKECPILSFNKKTSCLDIQFDTYGIRLKNNQNVSGDKITVKYKGEIGKPNFKIKL